MLRETFCKEERVNIPFHLPANILIAGETNSGKSCWIEKLIRHKDEMLKPAPSKILLLYRKMQPLYEEWAAKFDFIEMGEGINKESIENQKNNSEGGGTFLILDDLMLETMTDSYMQTVYTAGRHYNICGVLSVWHSLFPKGKNARLISLNCTAFVLLRSPRISSQVGTLGTQLGIRKRLLEAYTLATENQPYSYLLVDFTDRSNANAWRYSLRSNIFPSDDGFTIAYGSPSGQGEEM